MVSMGVVKSESISQLTGTTSYRPFLDSSFTRLMDGVNSMAFPS